MNDNDAAPTIMEASRDAAPVMIRAGAKHVAMLRDKYDLADDATHKALVGAAVRTAYNILRSDGLDREATRRRISFWLDVIENAEDQNGQEF